MAGLSSLTRPAKAASYMATAVSRPSPVGTRVRYIMPVPAGGRSGESWANAASIAQLSNMIAAVGPGGTVYVRADAGSYSFPANRVNINTGGQAGSPVTVMGVDQVLAP